MHTQDVWRRLCKEIEPAREHHSLPNILSEASNHLGAGKQQIYPQAAAALARYISNLNEIYCPSTDVIGIAEYMSVGLTDAAILSCVPKLAQEKVTVFTQDHELFNRLSGFDIACHNIMHWRTPKYP